MHWFCLAVGFLGMYGLCRRLGIRAQVGWVAACLFCYIPFYPTYGLAALGQPMLVLCGLRLGEGRRPRGAEKTSGSREMVSGHRSVCGLLLTDTDRLCVGGRRDSLDSLSGGGWPPGFAGQPV